MFSLEYTLLVEWMGGLLFEVFPNIKANSAKVSWDWS